MKELRTKLSEQGKSSSPPKEVIIRALKDRNWIGFIIAYVTWLVEIGCVTVGLGFYIVDGLGLPISMIGPPIAIFLIVVSQPLAIAVELRCVLPACILNLTNGNSIL